MLEAMALVQNNIRVQQNKHNEGCPSDNEEASDNEEPQDSGRTTRSSAKRNNQPSNQDTDSGSQSKSLGSTEKASGDSSDRGRKRKKNLTNSGDGSDSDSDRGGDKNRLKLDGTIKSENNNQSDLVVCSCPKNVMKCIGILPSLPIISYFHDSDESDSSFDDLSHVVLPIINRNPSGQKEDC